MATLKYWNSTTSQWERVGVVGPPGPKGETGASGAGTGNVNSSTAVVGNITEYATSDGTLIADSGIAVSDIVRLSNTQTIAGNKTFSGPITASAGIAATGTISATAFSGSGASLTGITISQVSGTVPIAQVPTGTSGTTVALGNHLHTGVYEPVLPGSGTTAHYLRGDKSWQTLDKAAVGLSNINNVAQVEIAGTQTITGAKTFSALVTASAGVSVTGTVTATTFSGSGASLTALPAANLTGTVAIGAIPTGTTGTTVALGNHTHTPSQVGLSNVTNDAQVAIAGTQTVTGTKTFSALVTASAGVTVTGTVTATTFSGSGASLTSLPAANLTGTAPIGAIPTGTSGTTVALGNHLHTGTYEPVIAAGTSGQYYRWDKTWAALNVAAVSGAAPLASPTFTGTVTVPDSSFTIAKISATGTRDSTTYLRGDGTFATVSAGASNLDALTDVVITAPATGEVIRYNGTNWVDAALTAGDVGLGNVTNTADASKTFAASQITSGTLAIGLIPTGTSGTTVALGNHLHTGVYEPVITTLPIAKGGTGSATQNFVDLTTNQASIGGNKTFTGYTTMSGYLWVDDDIEANSAIFNGGISATGTSSFEEEVSFGNGFTLNGGSAYILSLAPSRALALDAGGSIIHSATTSTELGYVSGVTSAIQTQLNDKASTSSLANKVAFSDYIQNNNSFGGKRLYVNDLNDALFKANERFTVTGNVYNKSGGTLVRTMTAAETASLFEGDGEAGFAFTSSQYAVININFNGAFSGYPYGNFILSYYYTNRPASVSARVYTNYAPHGVGWHALTPVAYVDNGSDNLIHTFANSIYGITDVEFTIQGGASGTTPVSLEMALDRFSTSNEMPFVSKYRANTLYSPLTAHTLVEKVVPLSGTSGTCTADLSKALIFTVVPTGNITLSMANAPSLTSALTVQIDFNCGSTVPTITYPSGMYHANGAPVAAVANKVLSITMQTFNGGATWKCSGSVFG